MLGSVLGGKRISVQRTNRPKLHSTQFLFSKKITLNRKYSAIIDEPKDSVLPEKEKIAKQQRITLQELKEWEKKFGNRVKEEMSDLEAARRQYYRDNAPVTPTNPPVVKNWRKEAIRVRKYLDEVEENKNRSNIDSENLSRAAQSAQNEEDFKAFKQLFSKTTDPKNMKIEEALQFFPNIVDHSEIEDLNTLQELLQQKEDMENDEIYDEETVEPEYEDVLPTILRLREGLNEQPEPNSPLPNVSYSEYCDLQETYGVLIAHDIEQYTKIFISELGNLQSIQNSREGLEESAPQSQKDSLSKTEKYLNIKLSYLESKIDTLETLLSKVVSQEANPSQVELIRLASSYSNPPAEIFEYFFYVSYGGKEQDQYYKRLAEQEKVNLKELYPEIYGRKDEYITKNAIYSEIDLKEEDSLEEFLDKCIDSAPLEDECHPAGEIEVPQSSLPKFTAKKLKLLQFLESQVAEIYKYKDLVSAKNNQIYNFLASENVFGEEILEPHLNESGLDTLKEEKEEKQEDEDEELIRYNNKIAVLFKIEQPKIVETELDTELNTELNTELDTELDTEPELDTEIGTERETVPELDTELVTELKTEQETELDTELGAELKTERGAESKIETELETESEEMDIDIEFPFISRLFPRLSVEQTQSFVPILRKIASGDLNFDVKQVTPLDEVSPKPPKELSETEYFKLLTDLKKNFTLNFTIPDTNYGANKYFRDYKQIMSSNENVSNEILELQRDLQLARILNNLETNEDMVCEESDLDSLLTPPTDKSQLSLFNSIYENEEREYLTIDQRTLNHDLVQTFGIEPPVFLKSIKMIEENDYLHAVNFSLKTEGLNDELDTELDSYSEFDEPKSREYVEDFEDIQEKELLEERSKNEEWTEFLAKNRAIMEWNDGEDVEYDQVYEPYEPPTFNFKLQDYINHEKNSEGWKNEKFYPNQEVDAIDYGIITTLIPEREGDEKIPFKEEEDIADFLVKYSGTKDDHSDEGNEFLPKINALPFNKEDRKTFGAGHRKACKAVAYVKPGTGVITVNNRPLLNYFPHLVSRCAVVAPLVATERLNEFDITINVKGGGFKGQAEAIKLALSRALENYDREFHPILRVCGLNRRDVRIVERKKPGKKKARKSFQWVKR